MHTYTYIIHIHTCTHIYIKGLFFKIYPFKICYVFGVCTYKPRVL